MHILENAQMINKWIILQLHCLFGCLFMFMHMCLCCVGVHLIYGSLVKSSSSKKKCWVDV